MKAPWNGLVQASEKPQIRIQGDCWNSLNDSQNKNAYVIFHAKHKIPFSQRMTRKTFENLTWAQFERTWPFPPYVTNSWGNWATFLSKLFKIMWMIAAACLDFPGISSMGKALNKTKTYFSYFKYESSSNYDAWTYLSSNLGKNLYI